MTDPAVISAASKWTYTNVNAQSFIFNDPGVGNFNVPEAWPFALLDYPVKGTRDLPALDDNTEPNTEANGVRELDQYARGKVITLVGKLYEQGWLALHEAINAMLLAFGPDPATGQLLDAGRMVVDSSPMSANLQTFLAVPRVASISEDYPDDETAQPSPYHASFSIDLRMADGRFFDWDGAAATNGKW